MLRWMAMSLPARGIWLIMSYIILAKGDKKAYFIYDALIGNGLLFLFNIIAYSKWGLQGLGISFLVGSIFVSITLFIVVKVKYEFNFEQQFLKIFSILMTLVILSFLAIYFLAGWVQYGFSLFLTILVFVYSFQILNKRIEILKMIKSKLT